MALARLANRVCACAVVVGFVMLTNMDTELGLTLATSSFTLAGMVVGSYVFVAVWNDKS